MTASQPETDARFMRLALEQVRKCAASQDVPVGAVVIDADGNVIGMGHNRREADQDPTAHAEIIALRAAARSTGLWRLDGATMYVTLEPCAMCAGALVNARISRLVYGCYDPKAGAVHSLFRIGADERLNHRFEITQGVLAAECMDLLRAFFAELRAAGEK